MSERTRVAKEQAREFYEKVVKTHLRGRYIVEPLHPANSPVIFTVWDTETNAPYKHCFATQAEAEKVCSYFNNKHRETPTKIKEIHLNAPTVRELIDALQKLPSDATITDSDIGDFVNLHIKSEHHHWDDDGDGNPVDYDIAEFSFYAINSDY